MNSISSKAELREAISSFSHRRDCLIQILEKAQQIYQYLPLEAEKMIAEELGIPLAYVVSVSSFYSFFHSDSASLYVIRVCTSTPCYVNKANKTLEAVEEALQIRAGETTADGRFRLETCGCLGACDKAPAIMVNEQLFGPVIPEDVKQMLACFGRRGE